MIKNSLKLINKEALLHNAIIIKKWNYPSKLCAVVKSNAYGHGIEKVIKATQNIVDYFAVNNIKEALIARQYTKKPILVIGVLDYSSINKAIENDIDLGVFCKKDIIKIAKNVKNSTKICKIHIKIDSGMHRLGFEKCCQFCDTLNFLKGNSNIEITGVFTHIGSGKGKRTQAQLTKFNAFCKNISKKCIIHYANSETAFYSKQKQNEMARVGLALYGYGNFPNLKPVMSVYSRIINISFVKRGKYIGYGNKHKTHSDKMIAVLGIGYADGLMRVYSKKGYVLINGKKAKIIANICMSMTIVDITKIKGVKLGDYAVVLGKSGNLEITANQIAKKCGTIPYEILTNFNSISCTKRKPKT